MAGTAFEILSSAIILVGLGGVILTLIDNKWEVQDLETLRIQANAEVFFIYSFHVCLCV